MTLTVDDVRAEARSQLACVERAHRQQLREALVEVGRHLGWDRQTVIRLSEAITGRPWRRCSTSQVLRVARVLLEVATALRCGSPAEDVIRAHVTHDDDQHRQTPWG
jgi:hypothetical protein